MFTLEERERERKEEEKEGEGVYIYIYNTLAENATNMQYWSIDLGRICPIYSSVTNFPGNMLADRPTVLVIGRNTSTPARNRTECS